jgi:hypothetical protein
MAEKSSPTGKITPMPSSFRSAAMDSPSGLEDPADIIADIDQALGYS